MFLIRLLDKVPLNVQDTGIQIAELLERGGAQVQGAIVTLVGGALVDDAASDSLGAVALEGDVNALVAGGVAPGLGTHHAGGQCHNGLLIPVPVYVAGTVAASDCEVRGEGKKSWKWGC